MRIGVLENDIYWQNQILNLLMKYQFELNIDYDISIFNNELELCKDIANIDLLFIDIELNNENGISVAKKISNQKKI